MSKARNPKGDLRTDFVTAQTAELYRIREWGGGYFDVNGAGDVVAVLEDEAGKESRISLLEVVKEMERLNLPLPAILRFPDILARRIRNQVAAFNGAIESLNYRGHYSGCFPIKVNQKRQVITEITSMSGAYHFGLEAGTKAELAAAVAHLRDREAYLVCNGYKDADFVDLALHATQAGLKVVIVLERANELDLVVERSRALGVEPCLGARIRIASSGSGRWSSTSGGQGLFGLTPLELIRAVDQLKSAGMLDCLHMLHFHQGSQIPDLNTIRRGLEEAANLYVELTTEGAKLGAINIGGGLAIDYEGAAVISHSSKNYSLKEYCRTVVEVIGEYMDANELPHPVIISESGRSISSHYSTLIFNILGTGASRSSEAYPPENEAPFELQRMFELLEEVTAGDAEAAMAEADALLYRCRLSFGAGDSNLRHLAGAERIRKALAAKISRILFKEERPVAHLGDSLAEYYYANFSMFQSLPDAWAIGQLFPIMPIHRLDEAPDCEGIIADITCDCDGKIRNYIGIHDERSSLPLHSLKPGEPYYLGAFLVGAYQETLGDIHNLFGRPTVVSVRVQEGEIHFDGIDDTDSVAGILQQVDYSEIDLFDGLTELADRAHSEGRISGAARNEMVRHFGVVLKSSTYLNSRRNPVAKETDAEDEEVEQAEVSTS